MKNKHRLRQFVLLFLFYNTFTAITAQELPATLHQTDEEHYSNPRIEGVGTSIITYHMPAQISPEKIDSIRFYLSGFNGIEHIQIDSDNSLIQLSFLQEASSISIYSIFQRIELYYFSKTNK